MRGRGRGVARLGVAVAVVVALAGCRTKDSSGDLVNGKTLFVERCSSCHTLARANAKGITGPNLDEAFAQSLRDGLGQDTIRGAVHQWILYPNTTQPMPAKLVTGEDAWDVASYVAATVSRGGEDTGVLADIGREAEQEKVAAKGGKLVIEADPSGQLAYLASAATAPPGALEVDSPNKSSVPHNIAIEGNGVDEVGPVISNGDTSTVQVDLQPGEYTFYCSVEGHRQGGMEGPLVVK